MKTDDVDADLLRRTLLALLPTLVLSDRAAAQDAARTQPESFRVALENDRLRVLEYVSRPGMGICGSGLHSHPPHLTVVLTDGRLRETMEDGKSQLIEQKNGLVFWSGAVTHVTENLSGREQRALLIELKDRKG
jgi:hypothetical protein